MEQLGLDFAAKAPAPEVTQVEIDRLINFLDGRGWTKRRDIEAATGLDERKVRAIARAARPRIISWPGSPGYRLWRDAAGNERLRAIDAFRSQEDDMRESRIIYERAYHGGFRG